MLLRVAHFSQCLSYELKLVLFFRKKKKCNRCISATKAQLQSRKISDVVTVNHTDICIEAAIQKDRIPCIMVVRPTGSWRLIRG